jgi:rubrerythrin
VEEGIKLDAIQLIEEAIAAEKAAQERYKQGAVDADDAETRSLFEQLAGWEDSHQALLKERLTTLKMIRGRR